MADERRRSLQKELEKVPGIKRVYFQPPSNTKMEYPCIEYGLGRIVTNRADNKLYFKAKSYDITVITPHADDPSIDYLLETFQSCKFDRQFKSDNLYHNVLTLFY